LNLLPLKIQYPRLRQIENPPAPKVNYQPLDQIQYQGIIAHEVAHALIQQNSQVSPLPPGAAAQEYLATVTQLSMSC